MKVLCLHGSYGSAVNFEIQLSPFVKAMEEIAPGRFKWVDGFHPATPPKGFDEYFGAPPLYRFFDYDSVNALSTLVVQLRDFSEGTDPQDTIRKIVQDQVIFESEAVRKTTDRLLELIAADPEIDGVLGYSEGAMTAATLILEEKRKFEEEGIPRRLKYGLFFAGWPPLCLKGEYSRTLLADEDEEMIDIPTCHIIGCRDPYIHGAMALYNVCDPDTAEIFDHGGGHTLPRDGTTIKELVSSVSSVTASPVAA
ncbi:hypothetical protein CDD83_5287 [Cordyceps sp. RAO-2017]|nr:hypothetical protein CDD83_5287 [Cordyceps sp. RAO-2017]